MEGVLLAYLVGAGVLMFAAWIDAATFPTEMWTRIGRSKVGWFVLILLSSGIGGLYYFLVIRRKLVKVRRKIERNRARVDEPADGFRQVY